MSREEFPAAIQEAPKVELQDPMHIGAAVLIELGVGYDVSGIRVMGPRPECNGTVAEIVGMEGHSALKDSIISVAKDAVSAGRDPSEAISTAISLFTQRDEKGNVLRVDESRLKKVDKPEIPHKAEALKTDQIQKTKNEKTAEPVSNKVKPITVKDAEIQVPWPKADILSQIEASKNARAIRQAEAYNKFVEAAQARVAEESPGVVEDTLVKLELPQGVQPIYIIKTVPDRLDVMPQIMPESISMADEEAAAGATIDSLKAATFEQPEESLFDDTHLTADSIEVGVDTSSPANIEEGSQRPEAEYTWELLVHMLAVTGVAQLEELDNAEVKNAQPFQTVMPAIETGIVNDPEAILIEGFEKDFNFYIESLEPEQVEATKNVIKELSDALKASQQLPEEATSEETEMVEGRLEELCVQLFEGLGLEYDEEIIKQFMQSITDQESLSKIDFESHQLSIGELNYLGTIEYKSLQNASLIAGLIQLIKQTMQSHTILGRCALHELKPSF